MAANKQILELIESYNSNTLWEMARAAKLPNTTGKRLNKVPLIALMVELYFQPERIKASYQSLSDLEKVVINRLLLRGGEAPTRLLHRELTRSGLTTELPPPPEPDPKKPYWQRSRTPEAYGRSVSRVADPDSPKSTVFEDVMARLTRRGLVFSKTNSQTTGGAPPKIQFHPADTLFIPPFVSEHLPPPVPIETTEQVWQPAHTRQGDPQHFLRDLYLYWDAVRRNPPALIQSGFVGKRGLKALNEALLMPDPAFESARSEDQTGRLYLLRQMLTQLGLIQAERGELRVKGKDGRFIPPFWQKSTAEQVADSLESWIRLPHPFRVSHPKAAGLSPNYQQAARLLMQVLQKSLPLIGNTWVEADDLLFNLQELDENFLFPNRSRVKQIRYGGYYGGEYYSNPAEAVRMMDEAETLFVAEVMTDFFFQMGAVELGYAAADNPLANWRVFRLTPLGEAALRGKGVAEETAVHGQIIIQPNFQILALGPVPFHLLAQLDLFAERQKVDPTGFEYRLSQQSVYAAQQAGYSVEEVAHFLDRHAPNDLPQNVRRSLDEWGAHHERIVFRKGVTLLQAADQALLERLLEDRQTGQYLARPAVEGEAAVALVKTGQQPKLNLALHISGLLPTISGANTASADKSVVVEENGRVRPIHAVPSFHLRGRLERFAELADEGWLVSQKSVRRAAGSKPKTQAILDELGRLNRGALPDSLAEQIKAWGGYYGNAKVGSYTLIEFRDQETLTELLAHPELRDYLQLFPAGNRALTAVSPDHLPQVQAVLSRLGVEING
jgi:hypothetical protein